MTEDKKDLTHFKARIDSLFEGAMGSAFVGTVVAGFLAVYLSNYIEGNGIFYWFACVLVAGIFRGAATVGYKKSTDKDQRKKFANLYIGGTYVYSAIWASSSLILMNQIPPGTQDTFFVTLLLGLASGGAISHVSLKSLANFYSISIVFCHALKVLLEGREHFIYILMAEILFILLLYKIVDRYNALYVSAQHMALELQDKLDLEQELQKQKVQALQKSKLASLGEMAAGMAHEINNPLTISIGKLNVLAKLIEKTQGLPPAFYKQIKSIVEANKRAAAIVNSIRNLSRMKEESEFQDFSMSELMEIVKPLITVKLSFNSVELIEDFEEDFFYADKGEISQVFLNILNNAIDAVKDRDGERWIKITIDEFEDQKQIKVIDCGLTADLGDIVKIFEPFYTTKKIGEGTGLGLSLARSIMERNGGSITLDTSGTNTCFVLALPRAIANNQMTS